MACESALQALDCIRDAFVSFQDAETLMEVVVRAEGQLWGGFTGQRVMKNFNERNAQFAAAQKPFELQNALLRDLCHRKRLATPKAPLRKKNNWVAREDGLS